MLPIERVGPRKALRSIHNGTTLQQHQSLRYPHAFQLYRRFKSTSDSTSISRVQPSFPEPLGTPSQSNLIRPLFLRQRRSVTFLRHSLLSQIRSRDWVDASVAAQQYGEPRSCQPLGLQVRVRSTISHSVASHQWTAGKVSAQVHARNIVSPADATQKRKTAISRPFDHPKKRFKSTSIPLSNSIPLKEPIQSPAAYEPPTRGLISYLPASFIPYAELIRLDKPTGTYYLFFPCLFSTLLASSLPPFTSPSAVLSTTLLFLTGAFIMRGAGCAINDLHDRKLDPHVTRTRLRPLARGALTPFSAIAFTSSQLLLGLVVLLQFPPSCLIYGIPSLLFVGTYPLFKRITHYPQFMLGLTFSWGAMMGFPALGIDLMGDSAARAAATCLYASCVAWTVLYDFIYAHMDVKDDVGAGIKSIAVKHGAQTRAILAGLAVIQVGFLAAAGSVVGFGPVFFAGSCGGAALSLGVMVSRVRLSSVSSCWWWFRNGAWFTGLAISSGLLGEYIGRWSGWVEVEEEKDEFKAEDII